MKGAETSHLFPSNLGILQDWPSFPEIQTTENVCAICLFLLNSSYSTEYDLFGWGKEENKFSQILVFSTQPHRHCNALILSVYK